MEKSDRILHAAFRTADVRERFGNLLNISPQTMNIEELREFCLSLKGAEESMPFDDEVLVFSIKGKMFCLTGISNYEFIILKCDPEEAIELRERHPEVSPGYHMNKKHWNSIRTDGSISDKLFREWIRKSYDLAVAGLPKKIRQELGL